MSAAGLDPPDLAEARLAESAADLDEIAAAIASDEAERITGIPRADLARRLASFLADCPPPRGRRLHAIAAICGLSVIPGAPGDEDSSRAA